MSDSKNRPWILVGAPYRQPDRQRIPVERSTYSSAKYARNHTPSPSQNDFFSGPLEHLDFATISYLALVNHCIRAPLARTLALVSQPCDVGSTVPLR
jgi:hypothetical protein